jgi:4-hydroxythreonine-4-phosphate dehydrogenase
LSTGCNPRIILTSGEPAGIGPDLCIAIAEGEWPCDLIFAGDAALFKDRAQRLGARIEIVSIANLPERREHRPSYMRVLHRPVAAEVRCGRLDPTNARYVLSLLDAAIDGCVRGDFDAMVTAPVQKSIINDAGIAFTGHTEYLAERTGPPLPVMMLASGNLRVALATTHVPLAAVSSTITRPLLEQVLRILDHDLRSKFGISAPRILVCGLNPHAGESGHMGREEIDVIAPVIEHLRQHGMQLIGPHPADTAFTPHMLKQADAVLAMYHDQGLPVIKHVGFSDAVNVTLGLPIVRTSVDHGTALDLAGTGKADAGSLIAALELAATLSTPSTLSTTSI